MSSFDPTAHMRNLKGQTYLDVKWRLVWLREVQPEAIVVTELIERTDAFALFRACVTLPSGGSASGYGSETKADFGDFIEKAETKALGRALAALGFGTAHAAELDEGGSVADAPVEAKATPAKPVQPDLDPALEQARAGLVEAMKTQSWTMQRVIETASWVWPQIQSKADFATLSPAQLGRLTEVVTGESVIHLDQRGHKRIMPAPAKPASVAAPVGVR